MLLLECFPPGSRWSRAVMPLSGHTEKPSDRKEKEMKQDPRQQNRHKRLGRCAHRRPDGHDCGRLRRAHPRGAPVPRQPRLGSGAVPRLRGPVRSRALHRRRRARPRPGLRHRQPRQHRALWHRHARHARRGLRDGCHRARRLVHLEESPPPRGRAARSCPCQRRSSCRRICPSCCRGSASTPFRSPISPSMGRIRQCTCSACSQRALARPW